MVSKERLSLSKQIIHCHAYNKRQVNPVRLDVVGLEGESRRGVEKMDGFPGSWGLFEDLTSIDKGEIERCMFIILALTPHTPSEASRDKRGCVGGGG